MFKDDTETREKMRRNLAPGLAPGAAQGSNSDFSVSTPL